MARLRALVPSGALLAVCALTSLGCGGQSTLEPKSGPARDIATLWWWMLVVASVVFVGAVAMLVLAWVRRNREGLPLLGGGQTLTTGLVVLFGMAIPIVVLVAVFVVANFVVLKNTDAPRASTTAMTIEVTGRQWFWEVRYPGSGAVTANEIHIPARTRVNVVLRTADVIHSFWVPQLNRKADTIPGHPNRILLYADKPGRYRGQCAEFCGAQHAHMSMYVFAEPPSRFRAWLAQQARPAVATSATLAQRGERVFMDHQCASCHTIRGTPAAGVVGPDLTHVGRRTTLAALTLPNTPRRLADWIRDPQYFKPGNRMPALALDRSEIDAVAAYLEGLK
jgi:cytochrome c oxidase subunit II